MDSATLQNSQLRAEVLGDSLDSEDDIFYDMSGSEVETDGEVDEATPADLAFLASDDDEEGGSDVDHDGVFEPPRRKKRRLLDSDDDSDDGGESDVVELAAPTATVGPLTTPTEDVPTEFEVPTPPTPPSEEEDSLGGGELDGDAWSDEETPLSDKSDYSDDDGEFDSDDEIPTRDLIPRTAKGVASEVIRLLSSMYTDS